MLQLVVFIHGFVLNMSIITAVHKISNNVFALLALKKTKLTNALVDYIMHRTLTTTTWKSKVFHTESKHVYFI